MPAPSTTKNFNILSRTKQCSLCTKNVTGIDWQDVSFLRQYLSAAMKIKPARKTKLCAKHQRQLARAIKRARMMSLLPFIPE